MLGLLNKVTICELVVGLRVKNYRIMTFFSDPLEYFSCTTVLSDRRTTLPTRKFLVNIGSFIYHLYQESS